jgi:hypothetical protein
MPSQSVPSLAMLHIFNYHTAVARGAILLSLMIYFS